MKRIMTKGRVTIPTDESFAEGIKAIAKKWGADAVGVQLCKLKKEFKSDDNIKNIFSCSNGRPYYVTNYRYGVNEGKTDDELVTDILHYASLGGDLYDVMGDIFDRSENEITYNAQAIEKQ